MKILFHGTQIGGLKTLVPMISLEFERFVYATDDIAYALVRAGKQLDEIREEYYGKDKPFEIAECYPDAFKHQFELPGYVYLLDSNDFELDSNTGEWKSRNPVAPFDCWCVNDIWNAMTNCSDRYRFIWNGDKDYWKNVRGGREGFLKRKLEAKQKMLRLRRELQ